MYVPAGLAVAWARELYRAPPPTPRLFFVLTVERRQRRKYPRPSSKVFFDFFAGAFKTNSTVRFFDFDRFPRLGRNVGVEPQSEPR